MKKILLIIFSFIISLSYSQKKDITGIYGEGLIGKFNPYGTYVELKADSTFVYNMLGKKYTGNWELSEDKVLLNPKIKQEFAKVTMKESKINSDSIAIKINYIPAKSSDSLQFRMATVYFDKKRDYVNILKSPYTRNCGWAPIVRKQHILNKENIITVSKRDFSKLQFITYNLKEKIAFKKQNTDSNFFEFQIEDILYDDTIKDSFLILDGNYLHFPNRKGKKDVMQMPLKKKTIFKKNPLQIRIPVR
ncbi:hypothetical protein ABEG63_01220 [Chryseobacterium sp. C39-AII1]|uniref:hypothetical protein n=1 Tax=Chryseobacterium sp. C39-AII1 TaxID=3080332 RepID=UPI003207BBD2